jgi:hypothetical protein
MSAAPERRVWGLLAEFETVEELLAAAEAVREAGYRRFDAHSPIPVHGIDEAMGIRVARVPLFALGGGITGCVAGLALQWFTNAFDYPFLVSGKPLFALPPFSNPWVWWGAGAMALLQAALTYWAPLNAVFATAPIGIDDWGRIAAVAVAAFFVIEAEKHLRARRM